MTVESRTQVYTNENGVLEVYANVVLQANAAGQYGGAVSLPFELVSHLPVEVFCDRALQGRLDSLRQLSKRR